MKDRPHNDKGEAPTGTPGETVERLEQKKAESRGEANRERIERQEREVGGDR